VKVFGCSDDCAQQLTAKSFNTSNALRKRTVTKPQKSRLFISLGDIEPILRHVWSIIIMGVGVLDFCGQGDALELPGAFRRFPQRSASSQYRPSFTRMAGCGNPCAAALRCTFFDEARWNHP